MVLKKVTTWTFALAAAAGFVLASAAPSHALFPQEQKCLSTLGKGVRKANKTYYKVVSKCIEKEMKGKGALPCPDPNPLSKDQVKIQKALDKAVKSANKSCASFCDHSNKPCIGNEFCPPYGAAAELCSGGAKLIKLNFRSMGFPGPYCETSAALDGPMTAPADFGICTDKLAFLTAGDFIDAMYGSASTVSGTVPDPATQKCLSKVSKATFKLADTAINGIFKCRDAINSGKSTILNPDDCTTLDTKLAAKISSAQAKLETTVDNLCTDGQIANLELCNGTATDKASAKACLVTGALEIAESDLDPTERLFAPVALRDAVYPPQPVCGDGIRNQSPNPFQILGEECDGDDDALCPGECLPPGDTFQCTCGNIPRSHFFADGFTADLDNGWTGTSHNSGVTDGAGFITTRENCDCDAFDTVLKCSRDRTTVCNTNTDCSSIGQGTCTVASQTCVGTSADPICDTNGSQHPVCSFDPFGSMSCDDYGNHNGEHTDADCQVCDSFTTNPGTSCTDNTACQSQCYDDTTGLPVGLCSFDTDCAAGQTCRGLCDASATCIITFNGAPLPIVSGATAVCVKTFFREDIFGTQNIVTGDAETFIRQFSQVHTGYTNVIPCPVCGGYCSGGDRDGELCEGTCSISGDSCRFDEDCTGGGGTCTTATPQCPGGGSCVLDLICEGGPNNGKTCRFEAATDKFGTTSTDCPASPSLNISGKGLEINFYPQTTGTTTLPQTVKCTAPGYELFDCPCVPDVVPIGTTARPTAPNNCAAACDAGAEFGVGCGIGTALAGTFTKCAGGINANKNCDDDSQCPGSTCSVNPKHCTAGDPAKALKICSVNTDCDTAMGSADGVCSDACPSGRCVPLCVPSDDPIFTSGPNDPEEGLCAAGPPSYHCSGAKFDFVACNAGIANGGCDSACSADKNACTTNADCIGGTTEPPTDFCVPPATCSVGGNPCPNGNDDCTAGGGDACMGSCPEATLCGAGTDGIYGNSNDVPGAGTCVPDNKNCFIPGGPGVAIESTGIPDPSTPRTVSTFCIGDTNSQPINNVAGLGGPGRLRQNGVNQPNFDCLGGGCP